MTSSNERTFLSLNVDHFFSAWLDYSSGNYRHDVNCTSFLLFVREILAVEESCLGFR